MCILADRSIDYINYTEIGVIAIGTLSQFLVYSKMQILGENQQRRRWMKPKNK